MEADNRPSGMADAKRPEEKVQAAPAKRRPRGFLYSEAQVVVAALFGSFLAGAYVLYTNEKNLRDASRFYLIIAVLALFAVSFMSNLFGDLVAGDYSALGVYVVNLAIVWYWFRRTQRDDVIEYLSSGTTRQKQWWKVIAIVLAVYGILIAVGFVIEVFFAFLGAMIVG